MEIKDFKDYIPLDKSWMIRMGVLDVLNNYFDIISFLHTQREDFLGDDLKDLRRACGAWNSDDPIELESATLYRFIQFASWKLGLNKKLVKKGTLKERPICNDPNIVKLPLEELLKLDECTSQWASASVLCGNQEKIKDSPYKLKLSYEAVDHWNSQRSQDFARAFGWISKEEGAKRWHSLAGHESNRLEAMEFYIDKLNHGVEIDSKYHRVVQSIAMFAESQHKAVDFTYPNCVNKSWPQFWDFLEVSRWLESPYSSKVHQ